jgi:hypothetical protein
MTHAAFSFGVQRLKALSADANFGIAKAMP